MTSPIEYSQAALKNRTKGRVVEKIKTYEEDGKK
jgi:hypothetical protein